MFGVSSMVVSFFRITHRPELVELPQAERPSRQSRRSRRRGDVGDGKKKAKTHGKVIFFSKKGMLFEVGDDFGGIFGKFEGPFGAFLLFFEMKALSLERSLEDR